MSIELTKLKKRLERKRADYSRQCEEFDKGQRKETEGINDMRLYKIEQIREIIEWIKETK